MFDRFRFFLIIISLSLFVPSAMSARGLSDNPSIGFNISQYQRDFGVGLNFITPYFCKDMLAIRLGGNIQWLQYADPETLWVSYGNMQAGIRARSFILEDKISVYGEGGLVMLFPNKMFSSKAFGIGGYGLFGFEFRISGRLSYFLELGGVGTGAVADRAPASPIYSNGFLTNVGFRVSL